jgi:hypothetical protein
MGLRRYLRENIASKFDNWVMPTDDVLKREFKVEHEIKGRSWFKSESEFLSAVRRGKIVTIDEQDDRDIMNRPHTTTKEQLFNRIKTYRSYPEFRNRDTLEALYDGFKTNKPMELPIVIVFENGVRDILSGNTRLDVAFQLGKEAKILLVKCDKPSWVW